MNLGRTDSGLLKVLLAEGTVGARQLNGIRFSWKTVQTITLVFPAMEFV